VLHLTFLVEIVSRNFDEKRVTDAVSLDEATALNTLWVDGLSYKFTILHFPSYFVINHILIPEWKDVRSVFRNRHIH
jgi:hypothetical protein